MTELLGVGKMSFPIARRSVPHARGLAWSAAKAATYGTTDPLWGTPGYDADLVQWPPTDEEGKCFKLNWSLNRDGVTPLVHAYRNLSARRLSIVENVPLERIVILGEATVQAEDASSAFFARFDAAVHHLDDCPKLFVNDMGAGSHRSTEVRVRTVTDSPATSAVLQKLLVPVPVREPKMNGHDILILAYSDDTTESQPFFAANNSYHPSCHASAAQIVTGGNVSLATLQSRVARSVEAVLAAREECDVVPLAGHSYTSSAGTSVVLGTGASAASKDAQIYGTYHCLWGVDGLTRMWGGDRLAGGKCGKGDIHAGKEVVKASAAANLTACVSFYHGRTRRHRTSCPETWQWSHDNCENMHGEVDLVLILTCVVWWLSGVFEADP